MKDSNKILIFTLIADIILLGYAVYAFNDNVRLPSGYYTFLRIVTCGVLVWLCCLLKSPYWRVTFGAFAILYNPVIPIHLGDREVWSIFNVITGILLIIAFFRWRKLITTQGD